jgi:hypothetical protein
MLVLLVQRIPYAFAERTDAAIRIIQEVPGLTVFKVLREYADLGGDIRVQSRADWRLPSLDQILLDLEAGQDIKEAVVQEELGDVLGEIWKLRAHRPRICGRAARGQGIQNARYPR